MNIDILKSHWHLNRDLFVMGKIVRFSVDIISAYRIFSRLLFFVTGGIFYAHGGYSGLYI